MDWRDPDTSRGGAASMTRSCKPARCSGGWRPVNRNIGGSSRLSKDPGEELPGCPVVSNKVDHTYIMKIL